MPRSSTPPSVRRRLESGTVTEYEFGISHVFELGNRRDDKLRREVKRQSVGCSKGL